VVTRTTSSVAGSLEKGLKKERMYAPWMHMVGKKKRTQRKKRGGESLPREGLKDKDSSGGVERIRGEGEKRREIRLRGRRHRGRKGVKKEVEILSKLP